jgi:hypothetical protein
MSWTDFLFGAIAGFSITLCGGAFLLYRIARPYWAGGKPGAKAGASSGETSTTPASWPVPRTPSN